MTRNVAQRRFASVAAAVITLLIVAALSCRPVSVSTNGDLRVTQVTWTASEFHTPESVRHDPDQDMYFVTNINGSPAGKTNDGYITRILPDSAMPRMRFIEGGRGGVVLNAPKGTAISGDTLWVADIDAMRGFHRRTAGQLAVIDFAPHGARFLNDVAIGPDSSVYITDTGLHVDEQGNFSAPGPFRVFRLGPNREISVVLEGGDLHTPNGITWDSRNSRFIIVSFGTSNIWEWRPGETAVRTIATGPGQFDGVEVHTDGRIMVSSWADSSVHVVEGNQVTRLIGDLPAPADIGFDARRNRVLVPLFMDNRVEAVPIGPPPPVRRTPVRD